ncbi:hypothetical protein MRB53_028448 [Persea americana]|uniref:Uncharacterized protein n=1 Tax=Persea americana TaxID=3435 RepID=A0ACC2KG37_PERAE|nr:hypothetical protein MRB53_028448 [Persea americana]
MAPTDAIKVLELSRVAPPPGSVSEALLLLTFFGVFWVLLPPVQQISSSHLKPAVRYIDKDSISFTVSESTAEFNHLVGNHPKEAEELHPFVSQLPPPSLLAL